MEVNHSVNDLTNLAGRIIWFVFPYSKFLYLTRQSNITQAFGITVKFYDF